MSGGGRLSTGFQIPHDNKPNQSFASLPLKYYFVLEIWSKREHTAAGREKRRKKIVPFKNLCFVKFFVFDTLTLGSSNMKTTQFLGDVSQISFNVKMPSTDDRIAARKKNKLGKITMPIVFDVIFFSFLFIIWMREKHNNV